MSAPLPQKNTFSWTEILVIVTVLGFLAAVLVPMMDRGRQRTRGSIAASNIRQIGQSALIYANDNGEQLPGLSLDANGEITEGSSTPNIKAIAAAMARQGGLNDAQVWIIPDDRNSDVKKKGMSTVLDFSRQKVSPDFALSAVSFQFIAGLDFAMPSTTPIAFTRGLQPDGYWANDRKTSVFGNEGGHIVFLGGNVGFYRNLVGDNRLVSRGGSARTSDDRHRTHNIRETIDSSALIFSEPATQTGGLNGMPGIAP